MFGVHTCRATEIAVRNRYVDRRHPTQISAVIDDVRDGRIVGKQSGMPQQYASTLIFLRCHPGAVQAFLSALSRPSLRPAE